MSDTRPVWLTRTQRDALQALANEDTFSNTACGYLLRAWDGAPADPVGVVTKELSRTFAGPTADSVLRALGRPDA